MKFVHGQDVIGSALTPPEPRWLLKGVGERSFGTELKLRFSKHVSSMPPLSLFPLHESCAIRRPGLNIRVVQPFCSGV
jgi:hypothetical protein